MTRLFCRIDCMFGARMKDAIKRVLLLRFYLKLCAYHDNMHTVIVDTLYRCCIDDSMALIPAIFIRANRTIVYRLRNASKWLAHVDVYFAWPTSRKGLPCANLALPRFV